MFEHFKVQDTKVFQGSSVQYFFVFLFLFVSLINQLPNETESLFLWNMIDSNLFKIIFGLSLSRPEHVYLEPDFDLLGEGALREYGLDLRHHGAVDHAALGPDGVNLLPDPGDDGEVLREVRGQDPCDAISVEILKLGHFWTNEWGYTKP